MDDCYVYVVTYMYIVMIQETKIKYTFIKLNMILQRNVYKLPLLLKSLPKIVKRKTYLTWFTGICQMVNSISYKITISMHYAKLLCVYAKEKTPINFIQYAFLQVS